jgi:hypothetical protein
MRAKEFITELKKKEIGSRDTTPHDFNPGWEKLNYLKKEAAEHGSKLANTYQLFVPRGIKTPTTSERSGKLLKNPWAWDEEGNLLPDYEKTYDIAKMRKEYDPTGKVNEAAPFLAPGRMPAMPGNNKPMGSHFWTSTAYKVGDKWSSDWNRWVLSNQSDWSSDVGYLYKVKPNALILSLNSDYDAEDIYRAFNDLGRVDSKARDHEEAYGYRSSMRMTFPWNEVTKHFDAVHHRYADRDSEFMYGWDVESTVWFDTRFLQYVGEVPVVNSDPNRDYDV